MIDWCQKNNLNTNQKIVFIFNLYQFLKGKLCHLLAFVKCFKYCYLFFSKKGKGETNLAINYRPFLNQFLPVSCLIFVKCKAQLYVCMHTYIYSFSAQFLGFMSNVGPDGIRNRNFILTLHILYQERNLTVDEMRLIL